jgi:hypothetical protein
MDTHHPNCWPPNPPFEIAQPPGAAYPFSVQRLFSMFPTGMAGAALLVLRVTVAATLVFDGTVHWALMTSFWILSGFAVPAILLCLGFLTPYCSALSCLIQLGVLISTGQNEFNLAISILNSGILAILGPGAYSIDAHIFGRRLLIVASRK